MCNKKQISENLKREGRNISSWSRLNGFKASTVHMALDGRLKKEGCAYRAIMAELEKGGYLTPADKDQAA